MKSTDFVALARAVLTVVIGLGLMSVAACERAAKPSSAGPPLQDRAGYATELTDAYDRFPWPSDHRPDLGRLIEATRPAPDERFPAGVTRAVLGVVNSCAWYLSWDAAATRGDSAARRGALRVMTEELPGYPPPEDPKGRAFVVRAAERAEAGDPAPVRQYIRANCGDIVWVRGR